MSILKTDVFAKAVNYFQPKRDFWGQTECTVNYTTNSLDDSRDCGCISAVITAMSYLLFQKYLLVNAVTIVDPCNWKASENIGS